MGQTVEDNPVTSDVYRGVIAGESRFPGIRRRIEGVWRGRKW